MAKTNVIKLVAGQDIGNGCLKCAAKNVEGHLFKADIPSAAAFVTSSRDIKPRADEIPEIVSDIFNYMDAVFNTPLVGNNVTRRMFGKRALQSGLNLEEFDVNSHMSKAKQDLSNILALATIAGFALQDYYNKNGALPTETLQVEARTALALPIEEYRHYRKEYADRFKECKHLVTILNFEQNVNIEITFVDVQVLAEGAAAQYAIQEKGLALMEAMLAKAMQNDPDFNADGSITPADVLAAQTVVGVDIGEGTVNFPVFQNGKFNADVSISYDRGYGSILTRAMERLQYESGGLPFKSRKELVDYLQTTPSAIKKGVYNKVTQVVAEETESFIIGLRQEFIKILSRIGAYLEVVYVYGGGSGPINKELQPELVKATKEFGGGYPVMYLDAQYSRNLNREGLLYIAEQVAAMDAKSKTAEKK